MSASLVGSEMCIRDRNCTWAFAGSTQMSLLVRSLCVELPLFMRSCVAVSYTHLTLPTICSV
eukprot:4068075-Alexandrium_andersonii.AAC.1